MADRSGSRALWDGGGPSLDPRPHVRRVHRRTRPAVELLEGRMLLAGSSSPTNPVPISPEPVGGPTPQQLGAAYRQVVEIQTTTLRALGTDYRRVETAAAQLAARANHAIRSDRHIAQVGAAIASDAVQGLDVARGVEDQNATKDKIYIPNRLFLFGLKAFVESAQTLGSILVGSARRSTNAVVHELNALGAQLARTVGPHP
jgi:hypothetical protein